MSLLFAYAVLDTRLVGECGGRFVGFVYATTFYQANKKAKKLCDHYKVIYAHGCPLDATLRGVKKTQR